LVRKLPGNAFGKKYVITADQFYGHIKTAKAIHEDGHFFILSYQANRYSYLFSDYLHQLIQNQGDVEFLVSSDGSMACLSMQDCKKCNFLFNCSSPVLESKLPAQKAGRLKPLVIREYNVQIHNLDRFDQYLNLYSFKHRVVSWKKSVSIRMIKFAKVVAWRLQIMMDNCKLTQVQHVQFEQLIIN
jgi:hypothetical protein